jgi:hypothetical protein
LRDGFAAAGSAIAMREAALAERAERLRESEARLRLASEAGGIGFFWADLATGETQWSETMYRLYGLESARPAPSMSIGGGHSTSSIRRIGMPRGSSAAPLLRTRRPEPSPSSSASAAATPARRAGSPAGESSSAARPAGLC